MAFDRVATDDANPGDPGTGSENRVREPPRHSGGWGRSAPLRLAWVERWFAELTTKKLRRGAHRSVRQLNADIRAWINTWNDNPRPFVWTKTADQILESIARYCNRINQSQH